MRATLQFAPDAWQAKWQAITQSLLEFGQK
jgi:hypothetical protein